MVKELVKIKFSFKYIDNISNSCDVLFMAKNDFINYEDNEAVKRIVEKYIEETDLSMELVQIIKVQSMGKRLFN